MKNLIGAAVALALGGLLSLAHADADPQLQALIDGRAGQLSADQERLQQLEATNSELQSLESRTGDLTPEGRDAALALEAAANAFEQAAADLSADLRNAADNPDSLTPERLREFGEQQTRVNELGIALGDAANAATDTGARRFTFNGTTFFSQSQLVIQNNLTVQLGNFEGRPISLDDNILGPLDQRLRRLADSVDKFVEDGKEFNSAPKAAEIERLDQLRDESGDRNAEILEIEQRAERQGNGAGVLDALGDRLGGNTDDTTNDLANNQEAGDRVRELAEGLAGAGQRLAEIDQEIAEQEAIADRDRSEEEDLGDEVFRLQALLQDRESLEESREQVGATLEAQRKDLEQSREDGVSEEQLRASEAFLERLQKAVNAIDAALDGFGSRTNAETDFIKAQIEETERKRLELQRIRNDAADRQKELQQERDAIAGLQGELEDLIRNGAPLNEPGATPPTAENSGSNSDDTADALDSFLGGNDNDGPVTDSGTGPDGLDSSDNPVILDNLADDDPLGLNQFGFDADQGATENILNGQNNIALIPCPPGSNALPVGTLVSNTAVCFI